MFRSWSKPSAVMVILCQTEQPAVLLIERPKTLHHHGGQLALPGGSFDAEQDTSLWDTARRETQEEVGILVAPDACWGYLNPVYIPVTGFTLLPAVTVLFSQPPVHPQSGEVHDYAWVTLKELQRVRGMGQVGLYRMPEFSLTFGRLWGATARVVDNLLSGLEEGDANACPSLNGL